MKTTGNTCRWRRFVVVLGTLKYIRVSWLGRPSRERLTESRDARRVAKRECNMKHQSTCYIKINNHMHLFILGLKNIHLASVVKVYKKSYH